MYHLTEFDGIPLPVGNPSQGHDSTVVDSSLLRSAGGLFDYYGARRRRGNGMQLQITGLYHGETETIVDETGDPLVDHTGDVWVTGDEGADLRAKVDAIRGRVGRQGQLRRTMLPGTAYQWVTARLLSVPWPQDVEDRLWKAQVTCVFESAMEAWRAQTQTATVANLIGNATVALSVEQRGTVTVADATLQIVASGTITSVQVRNAAQGVDWTWTGTLNSDQTLTIDDGAQTVRIGNTDAYSGMSFAAGHTAQGWLPIANGQNLYTVLADAGGTATLRHYDQWL